MKLGRINHLFVLKTRKSLFSNGCSKIYNRITHLLRNHWIAAGRTVQHAEKQVFRSVML